MYELAHKLLVKHGYDVKHEIKVFPHDMVEIIADLEYIVRKELTEENKAYIEEVNRRLTQERKDYIKLVEKYATLRKDYDILAGKLKETDNKRLSFKSNKKSIERVGKEVECRTSPSLELVRER